MAPFSFQVGDIVVNFGQRALVLSVTRKGEPMPSGSGFAADEDYLVLQGAGKEDCRWIAVPRFCHLERRYGRGA